MYNKNITNNKLIAGGKAMKKSGSSIFIIFIIIAIIAMIATTSIMDGIGFALSVFIVIFSLMCIIGAIFLIITFFVEIKNKKMSAFGYLILAVVLAVLGIKILKWLIGVLI